MPGIIMVPSFGLLLCLYMILYIFARVFVVVESFINISFLPDTVYEMLH